MERDQILDVVVRHIKLNVDGVEDVDIDPTRSIKDYQASSLDIVEIVSSSMRELAVSVPRTELANLKNIDELVDLFYAAKKRSS